MGKVFVAGSMNMDVVAYAPRLPLAGETILGDRVGFSPGGKGLNPAVAASRLGAQVELIGCLGQDAFGGQLSDFAKEQGIGLLHTISTDQAHSGTAVILVAESGQNQIVVVPGANALLTPERAAGVDAPSGSVFLTLFEIPLPTVEAFLKRGHEVGAKTLLSPSPAMPCGFLDLPDILILNETELASYLGEPVPESKEVEAARRLCGRPDQIVIVTLGARGAVAIEGGRDILIPGRTVQAVDTTAAGDCFNGALAARLAQGDALESALHFANTAASISVTRSGAAVAMPEAREVWAALSR